MYTVSLGGVGPVFPMNTTQTVMTMGVECHFINFPTPLSRTHISW